MTTALSIADALGRKNIAEAVGVKATAVSNAVARDKRFPSSWFVAVSRLCEEAHLACPPEIFGMRGVPSDNGSTNGEVGQPAGGEIG